jgi:hypothetical protein
MRTKKRKGGDKKTKRKQKGLSKTADSKLSPMKSTLTQP